MTENDEGAERKRILRFPVEVFPCRLPALKSLRDEGYLTVEDVATLHRAELERIPKVGETSIKEIEHWLRSKGLRLGMKKTKKKKK